MKKKFENLFTELVTHKFAIYLYIIGFIVGTGVVGILVSISRGDFGSVADWVSGIGSFCAILAVFYQVKEQRKEYEKDRTAHLLIACWTRNKMHNSSNGGKVFGDRELAFWATNDGNTAGSFKFIGIGTLELYNKIEHAKTDNEKGEYLEQLCGVDGVFSMESEKPFEKIEPKCVSKTETISMRYIDSKFEKGERLCLVYMDPIGNTYGKEIY